ncbi:hypothetical protein PPL_06326 [Heterostelium album PN500]|uniref:Clu domain-containing protein n=1 Tax=Heterostelium pallidum (strain ATCC 26659 / Pp 5 / PN500) TaxID=670386 RepID=D3BCU8_HETP5|nr:hypothetical protein PPL_06326 [Heterostelium album PN500]EFA80740.1 hypothetical protein PPL_06326 [Heterostelium album PN500]|eukprot:XP_020432860.1 hypothetical protein PPL_06326 [Heterostelium album PN500]
MSGYDNNNNNNNFETKKNDDENQTLSFDIKQTSLYNSANPYLNSYIKSYNSYQTLNSSPQINQQQQSNNNNNNNSDNNAYDNDSNKNDNTTHSYGTIEGSDSAYSIMPTVSITTSTSTSTTPSTKTNNNSYSNDSDNSNMSVGYDNNSLVDSSSSSSFNGNSSNSSICNTPRSPRPSSATPDLDAIERESRERKLLQSREERDRDKGRDWNQEFQSLLKEPYCLDKFEKLTFVAMDFVKAAETYGKLIIKEMFMPIALRTIKPTKIGGIAGGDKYICQNILFKFAYDQKINDQWLYGGNFPSEYGASKAAGNELRGLSYFFQNLMDYDLVNKISVPLMCIIDYYGYRLVAISLLPINKETLIYGSCDGGHNVHSDIQEVNDIMEKVAKGMNLRGHLSGLNPKFLYGPGDFEIHRSISSQSDLYYSLDFARLLPPQAYFDEYNNSISHREIFYKLLRPELIRTYDTPLSSDAFSGWSAADPNYKSYNQDVTDATNHLYDVIIREAATELESRKDSDLKKLDLAVEVHKFGINLRHLGRLRSQVDSHNTNLRKAILNEMVERILKNKIKDDLRLNLSGHFIGSEEKCIETIVNFLNRLFNVDRFLPSQKPFWTVTIKSLIVEKYGADCCGLTEAELDNKYDLIKSIDLSTVISLFQSKTGIKLSSRVRNILADNKLPRVLYTDVKSVLPLVKHSNMIARSEGISLYMKALEMIYSNNVCYGKASRPPNYSYFNREYYEELSLLAQCKSKLELASRSSTTDAILYQLLGLVDIEVYKMSEQYAESPHLQSAEKNFLTSLSYHYAPGTLVSLGTVYGLMCKMDNANKQYLALSRFNPADFIDTLFESGSLYTPYFSYQNYFYTNYIPTSLHQLLVLRSYLEKMDVDNPMRKQYLHRTLKQVSMLLLRSLQVSDCYRQQYVLNAIRLYLNLPPKKLMTEMDVAEDGGTLLEQIIIDEPNILDDIMAASATSQYGSVPFLVLIKYIPYSKSLCHLVERLLNESPLSNFHLQEEHEMTSTPISTSILCGLNVQFDSLKIQKKNSENIPISVLSKQANLRKLRLEGLYFANADCLLAILSLLQPTLENLHINCFNNCPGDLQTLPIISLPNLKTVHIQEFTFNNSSKILNMLVLSFVSSVESLSLENLPDFNYDLLIQMTKLKSLKFRYMKRISPEILPATLEEFNGLYYIDDLAKLMTRCPKIKSIICRSSDFDYPIFKQLKVLAGHPLEHLVIDISQKLLTEHDMHLGIDVLASSLKHADFYINAYGSFVHMTEFLTAFKNLTVLHLDFREFNDTHLAHVIANLTQVTDFFCNSNELHLSNSDLKQWSSVKILQLKSIASPKTNFLNLGLVFPNIIHLSLSDPINFQDTDLMNIVENINPLLESLKLGICSFLTDGPIIELSKHLLSLTHIDFLLNVGDACIIKLAESLPKLKSIHTRPFKSEKADQFFNSRYSHITLRRNLTY